MNSGQFDISTLPTPCLIVPEAAAERLASETAFEAVEAALIAAANGSGVTFPVVIGNGLTPGESFSIKSGTSANERLVGLKVGSFWPGNPTRGLERHSSSVLLLDADSGRLQAVVEAGHMNGIRTAAANVAATRRLMRSGSDTLGVLGAGAQASHEIKALLRLGCFRRVGISSRDHARAETMARVFALQYAHVSFEALDAEQVCRSAHVLVTATSAHAPLFADEWIQPGTHISAMGADQAGKQELPVALLTRASLFADYIPQSVVIGEFQHASAADQARITAIGDVLLGKAEGRKFPEQITVFDSSGLALQDLHVAAAVLARYIAETS